MEISMLRNKMVTEDGVTTRYLEAGETYTLDDKIGNLLIDEGIAAMPAKTNKREPQK